MKKILNYSIKAISLPFFVGAFIFWLTADQPDCNALSLGGCGVFDVGIFGSLKSMASWLIVVLVSMPGAILWKLSDTVFPLDDRQT